MAKIDISPLELIKKSHYKSIFRLTSIFQDKENGLQQKHYRYALQKGKNVKSQLKYLLTFFQDANGNDLLKPLYDSEYVQKDCIDNNNTLSNFLSLLVKKGILRVVNPGEKNKRYKTRLSFVNYLSKTHIKSEIDRYDNEMMEMVSIFLNQELKFSDEKVIEGYLFGFPLYLLADESLKKEAGVDYSFFDPEDIKLLKTKLLQIHLLAMDIAEIKSKYTKDGISKICLFIDVAIQPQLKDMFKALDKLNLEFQEMTKNLKNGFRC